MKTFNELQKIANKHGFTLKMEDKNRIDETQVVAIYKGNERISRYKNVAATEKAFVHLIDQENE